MDFVPRYTSFNDCPWIVDQMLSRDFIKQFFPDTISFLIKCISSDNYIYGIFDEGVFLYEGKDTKPFLHELFIYGYDCELQIFYTADFFGGKYSTKEVSFDEIDKAYQNVNWAEDYLRKDRTTILLAKFNQTAEYRFDVFLVKQNLNDYLSSKMSYEYRRISMNLPCEYAFGLSSYDGVIGHVNALLSDSTVPDVKPFHALYIHKQLMVNRVTFMMDNGYMEKDLELIKRFESMQDKALVLRNKYIKCTLAKNNNVLKEIIFSLENIRIAEKSAIEDMLQRI